MLVPSSSINMERCVDISCEVGHMLTYVRKWRLLLVLNLTKETIHENKEIKVKKNVQKIST